MMNRVVLFGFFFTLLYILASSLPQEVNRKVKTKEHSEKRLTGNEQKKESHNKKKTFTKGQLGSKRKAGKKGRRRPRQGKTNKGKAKRNSSKKNSAKKHKTTKKKDKLKHENANNINVIKNTQRKRKAIKKKKQDKRKKEVKSSTNGKASQNSQNSQNWSVSDSCFANATASLQIRRTLVQNFERQRLRFERFRKVTKGKSMKGNFFTTAALKIMSAGGGNMTGLSCHNVAKSVGAKDMKSVVEELLQCEENIQKSCNYAAIAFTNQTKVSLHGWFRLEDMIFSFRLMNVMPMSRISIPW